MLFYSFSKYLKFYLKFLAIEKNGLLRNIGLISKFMTSQPGYKTITTHIDISRSKVNQTRKFGHLIEYNKRILFCKNDAESEAVRLMPDLFLFFKKALYEVKPSGLQLSFNIYR